jgi:hypothetical protein
MMKIATMDRFTMDAMRAWVGFAVLFVLLVTVASFAAVPGDDDRALFDVTLGGNVDLRPGDVYRESLFVWQCCVYPVATPVPARYVVDPPNAGVSVDARTGVVTVDPNAYAGVSVRVYAILLGGKRVVSHEIHVYDERSHPLVGQWRQTADLLCFAGSPTPFQWPPRVPIQDLTFHADGTYTMVRVPLEISHDLAGPYFADSVDRNIILGVGAGRRLPPNFRAQGTYELKSGTPQQLVLRGAWFGSAPEFGEGCGGVFVRER